MRDSEKHAKLKRKAKKFLKSLGFEDITTEYQTGVRYSDYYFIMNREARVDVVGFKGDRIALVECGDTPGGKLRTLARHFEEIYHLPYNGEIIRVKRKPPRNIWENRLRARKGECSRVVSEKSARWGHDCIHCVFL